MLASLLPEECQAVVVEVATATVDLDQLWPEERAGIASAVERRQREFAIGRLAARLAIERLGSLAEPGPIPIGPGREPRWPPGHVGSISHTRDVVAAAVGRADTVPSIGIDVATDGSVARELHRRILTSSEQAFAAANPDLDVATITFSAKEALYKALYPVHACWLGFLDVEFQLTPSAVGGDGDDGGGVLVASILPEADHPMAGQQVHGRWGRALGQVFTALWS